MRPKTNIHLSCGFGPQPDPLSPVGELNIAGMKFQSGGTSFGPNSLHCPLVHGALRFISHHPFKLLPTSYPPYRFMSLKLMPKTLAVPNKNFGIYSFSVYNN